MPNFTKILILLFLLLASVNAQYANTKVRDKNAEYKDSLKSIEYDRALPILGAGAYKKGFDIPYPMGIMVNGMWMDQGLIINNLQLGFQSADDPANSFPLTPVVDSNGTELLRFGENNNTSYSINFRPDVWIFPFLNVYGIFGFGESHTEVIIDGIGDLDFSTPILSVVDQGITTAGVGVLGAGGVGPVWLSGDFNLTWNKPELVEKATMANVLGMRVGHTFVLKNRPQMNFGIWGGAMRISMVSETVGAVKMKDAIPQETWDKKDDIVLEYWNWYDNEANGAQRLIADQILTPIINGLDPKNGESIIEYGIDKQVEKRWNMVLGAQFQLNKSWQLRFEMGLLGARTSFMGNVNYRFLGPKKRKK